MQSHVGGCFVSAAARRTAAQRDPRNDKYAGVLSFCPDWKCLSLRASEMSEATPKLVCKTTLGIASSAPLRSAILAMTNKRLTLCQDD
jgi:hypothetical protein